MKTNHKKGLWLLMFTVVAACGGADQQAEDNESSGQSVPITVTTAVSDDFEIWESSVGQLEPKVAPLVAAQVAGQLTAVNFDVGDRVERGQILASIDATDFHLASKVAQANIDRLQALIHAQQLKVNRYHELINKNSVNQSTLDDAAAQLGALQAELVSAQARLQQAQRNLTKTSITSPVNGRVDHTQVSKGDYVKVGDPLMRIADSQHLKIRLPYPETLLPNLRAGLLVRLSSPSAPHVNIETIVSEVRPSITLGSRSAQVIVNVENPGPWEPGATVSGAVRVAVHENATLLPELCIVRRAVGTVVYVVSQGKAMQRQVTTGLLRDGQVEILSGLKAGEQVAADGAGFLSDGVAVAVKDK